MLQTMIYSLLVIPLAYGQDSDRREPFIRYHPEDTEVSKGETIRLQCFVYGNPIPDVTWYKDGHVLSENKTAGRLFEVDKTLVILKARRNSRHDDTGVYFCVARNMLGVYYSKNATVKVRYLGKIFRLAPKNATINLHDSHTLRCDPPLGFPNATIEWQHNNIPLVPKKYVVKITQVGTESQVHFDRVTWQYRGLYTCVARSSEGERMASAHLTLKVIEPKLYTQEKLVNTHVGKLFQLQCFNTFEPKPTIAWSRIGGKEMPEPSRVQYQYSNSLMMVSAAKMSDSGEYRCVATNDAGEKSLVLKVAVYEKPALQVQPVSVEIGRGKTAKFKCGVIGGKNTKIGWFYGKDFYNQRLSGVGVTVDSSNALIISNVDVAKPKPIHCVYSDEIVSTQRYSARALLKVIGSTKPPPQVHVLPRVTQFEKDSQVLPCTVSGLDPSNPKVSIKWVTSIDNKPVDTGATTVWISSGPTSANLTIQNLLTTDTGGYSCIVNSSTGTAYNVTILTVKPLIAEVPPKVLDLAYMDVTATSVTLKWTRPRTAILRPVLSYVIKLGNVEKARVDGTKDRYTVTGLRPSTTYTFNIYAINKEGDGKIATFPTIETSQAIVKPDPDPNVDKLETVHMQMDIGAVTSSTIEVKWKAVEPHRITGYVVKFKESTRTIFQESRIIDKTETSIILHSFKPNTEYTLKMVAIGHGKSRESKESDEERVKTLQALILTPQNVHIKKLTDSDMIVGWEIPVASLASLSKVEILVYHSLPRQIFAKIQVSKKNKFQVVGGLDSSKTYYVSVALTTSAGQIRKSKEVVVPWASLALNGRLPKEQPTTPPSKKNDDTNILKETWFIVTMGVLVWVILLVIVIVICCRRRDKNKFRGSSSIYESRGLLPGHDYPNTSLNRSRLHDQHSDHYSLVGKKKSTKKCCLCCRAASESSLEDDFPNRAHIKPFNAYPHGESFEMQGKPDGMGPLKPNNAGIAMRNGYMVGAPLNNERNNYRQNSIENRQYNGHMDRMSGSIPPSIKREAPPVPGSGSMSRRHQQTPDYKMDSVERRLGEIVRTNKQTEQDVNVLANNPQASWKRDKPKDSPTLSPKPPGENTLRRQGKTQFKPLPKLEVLNWADGLPDPSLAASTNDGSPPGSPKTSSAFSEVDNGRSDSRLSHGESNNSLNKYSSHRRRRNSNASSMMSSELYQSEMDPSGYSDIVSEKKKKKEKNIPPPIQFDGITSDILLQWAESVTNSSPSSSGSSSPSRLSGISSEGSLYTDEDFAQAVAAVAECGGFNMDYDYNLPGMNSTPVPLSATRNSKMNKIDQVLAQRQKNRNPPSVPGSKPAGLQTPQSFIPQISMSSYLTGSSKGPQSTHSGSSGLPRPTRTKDKSIPSSVRYGTGFDDIGSVSSTSSKPLTVSNLMKHDSSLDRGKKESSQPLTVSNLRQHDSSLDRERRVKQQQPITYDKPPPYDAPNHNTSGAYRQQERQLLPEAPSLVTSALERHESMNSNSKDSINSSNRHDSEIENNSSTSERKQQKKGKKYYNRDPKSSTSTVSTVRTTPEYEDDENDTEC